MAYGGGTFTAQDKIVPGAYINIVSAEKAESMVSGRGTVAIGMNLDWGEAENLLKIKREDAVKNALKIFGRTWDSDELRWLREIFRNAKELLLYRLNKGGAKASNTYATAKHTGTRGNALKVRVQSRLSGKKEVTLFLDEKVVDTQIVSAASELNANDYVDWKSGNLEVNTGLAMSGGTDGIVNGESHQAFLSALESEAYHALGLPAEDDETKNIYIAYIKRMRDEIGLKAQLVLYDKNADNEGVINVKNAKNLVYWVLGAVGGCPVEKSLTNKKYDGEFRFKANYTYFELAEAIESGEFVLHRVGDEVRVLRDTNSLRTLTEEKGKDFKSGQTVRTLDTIATGIARIFNTKYQGQIANTDSGRISLWGDIVAYCKALSDIEAIEPADGEKIIVSRGENKTGVTVSLPVVPVSAMEQLYMTVVVG